MMHIVLDEYRSARDAFVGVLSMNDLTKPFFFVEKKQLIPSYAIAIGSASLPVFNENTFISSYTPTMLYAELPFIRTLTSLEDNYECYKTLVQRLTPLLTSRLSSMTF
jgi:hypothetical protein